jgi:hypothetical protein
MRIPYLFNTHKIEVWVILKISINGATQIIIIIIIIIKLISHIVS